MLAPERLIFYSLLLLWIVFTTVILYFHGYQYQTFWILNAIVVMTNIVFFACENLVDNLPLAF